MTNKKNQVVDISEYCSIDGSALSFSREQASHFAKQIAGDFNPIHNVDYKRFCVPGDLLFAVMLSQFGVSPETKVSFDGMVNYFFRLANSICCHWSHWFFLVDPLELDLSKP